MVLEKFHEFLCSHGLLCRQTGRRLQKFTWATDGPCDIRDFVVKQCFISKVGLTDQFGLLIVILEDGGAGVLER